MNLNVAKDLKLAKSLQELKLERNACTFLHYFVVFGRIWPYSTNINLTLYIKLAFELVFVRVS